MLQDTSTIHSTKTIDMKTSSGTMKSSGAEGGAGSDGKTGNSMANLKAFSERIRGRASVQESKIALRAQAFMVKQDSMDESATSAAHALPTVDVDKLKDSRDILLYKLMRLYELRTYLSLDQEHKHEIQCEWQQLAMLIDRFMFFLFVFMTVIVWIVYFANFPDYENDIII